MESLGFMMGHPPRPEVIAEQREENNVIKKIQELMRMNSRGNYENETNKIIPARKSKQRRILSEDASASTLLLTQASTQKCLNKYLIKSSLDLFQHAYKNYLLGQYYINQSVENLHRYACVLSKFKSDENIKRANNLSHRIIKCKEKVKKLLEKPSIGSCELKKVNSPTKLHTGLLKISIQFSTDYNNLTFSVNNQENFLFSNSIIVKKANEKLENIYSVSIGQKHWQMNLNPFDLLKESYTCKLCIFYYGTAVSNVCNLGVLNIEKTTGSEFHVKNITSLPIDCTGMFLKDGECKKHERILLSPLEIRVLNFGIDFREYDYFAYYQGDGENNTRLSNKMFSGVT